MELNKIKCDHCGLLHEPVQTVDFITAKLFPTANARPIEPIHIRIQRKDDATEFFDFCNEDCLREFFVQRKAKAMSPQEQTAVPA